MTVALSSPVTNFGLFGSRPKRKLPMMTEDPEAMQPGQLPALQAQEATPGHWTIGGFDHLRNQQSTANLPRIQQQNGPLGGSMRQPFDYAGALKALQGEQKKPSTGKWIAAALGDALIRNSGGTPWAMNYLLSQQQGQQTRQQSLALVPLA